MSQARVYFASGEYASVAADSVFEAVATALSARQVVSNPEVVKVELDIMARYQRDPDYV